jgi:hypothetical protein
MLARLFEVIILGSIALVYGCAGDDEIPPEAASGGVTAGSSGSGAGGASSSVSTSTASTGGGGCNYPPVNNPEGCPPAFSQSFQGQPCSNDGLECWYPGVGDGLPDGCNASALLRCTTDFTDGGAEWVAAQ